MKTFSLKGGDIEKSWYVVDVEGAVLGRVASLVSKILCGKHKPTYTPHLDTGDCVIILNASKIRLTGNKRKEKTYYWHTGYPGGIKSRKAGNILDGAFPERVFEKAVERMMTAGPLRKKRMGNLYVYGGDTHRHEAQRPEVLDLKRINAKNTQYVTI